MSLLKAVVQNQPGRASCTEICSMTSTQFTSYIRISRISHARKNSEGEEKMASIQL